MPIPNDRFTGADRFEYREPREPRDFDYARADELEELTRQERRMLEVAERVIRGETMIAAELDAAPFLAVEDEEAGGQE